MKRDLRIVFMGTPEFALRPLKALMDKAYNVVGVITAPDRPAGRGRKLKESPVKLYAQEKGLTILQPTNLKNQHFLTALEALSPNLQIVVAFRMLPKVVWQLPRYGTFNLHASLLPNYRGAAPINWALINGETKTGVTTFFIDDKIDTGEIILQKEIAISPDENVGSLHDKLVKIGSDLVLETVNQIEKDTVSTTKQPHDVALKAAPKLNKENCKINWHLDVDMIYNHIRGLSPYPAAWTIIKNGEEEFTAKIFKVEKLNETHQHSIGQIIVVNNTIKVVVQNGTIQIKEIQLAGKKRMDVKSLLNGFSFFEDAQMR